jgi:hypothetical protein
MVVFINSCFSLVVFEGILMFIERNVREIYFASNITFAEYRDHIVGGMDKGIVAVTDKGIYHVILY